MVHYLWRAIFTVGYFMFGLANGSYYIQTLSHRVFILLRNNDVNLIWNTIFFIGIFINIKSHKHILSITELNLHS